VTSLTRSSEPDASLRRIQRDAAILCLVSTVIALLVMRGRPEGAVGVLAGGALMAVSYLAIKGGVDAALRRAAGRSGEQAAPPAGAGRAGAWAAFRFVARYGVIAGLAWVVLVPLRAHPVGVVAGVSAPVLAIAIEGVRLFLMRSRPQGRGGSEGGG
jgi:hypothetical protein